MTICTIRLASYSFPKYKDKNFTTLVVISNPVIIEDGTFVLKSNGLTFYSHIPFSYNLGDRLQIKGNKSGSSVYINKIKYVGKGGYLEQCLYLIKTNLIASIKSTVLEPFASLMLGMLYGIEPNFAPNFNDILIKSGVIHIIVVSGYNITILFSVLGGLLRTLSRKKQLIFCMLFGIFYSFLVGFEPPIFRALVFGVLLMYAKSLGYKTNLVYLLVITSVVMCIISPSVLFSVSFQLSVLSTMGIILLNPLFQPLIGIKKFHIPEIIIESFFTSLSAQIFVLPILLYYFKTISTVSLITNTFILWVVPLIMFLSFVYSVFSILYIPFASQFVLFLVYLPLSLFVDFVSFMANIPYSDLSVSLKIYEVFALYIVFIVFIALLYKFKKIDVKNN